MERVAWRQGEGKRGLVGEKRARLEPQVERLAWAGRPTRIGLIQALIPMGLLALGQTGR